MRVTKFIEIILVLFIFASLSFDVEPRPISQSKALLNADIIFEGYVLKVDDNKVVIKIITPIWNDLKKSDFFKQSEITLLRDSKMNYVVSGILPGINEKAIFVLKQNKNSKMIKNFYKDWYITKLENGQTLYYIWGYYSNTKGEYFASHDIINGIKTLRKCYEKDNDFFQETYIKPKISLKQIEIEKLKNNAAKILLEDIEAFNKQFTK